MSFKTIFTYLQQIICLAAVLRNGARVCRLGEIELTKGMPISPPHPPPRPPPPPPPPPPIPPPPST